MTIIIQKAKKTGRKGYFGKEIDSSIKKTTQMMREMRILIGRRIYDGKLRPILIRKSVE